MSTPQTLIARLDDATRGSPDLSAEVAAALGSAPADWTTSADVGIRHMRQLGVRLRLEKTETSTRYELWRVHATLRRKGRDASNVQASAWGLPIALSIAALRLHEPLPPLLDRLRTYYDGSPELSAEVGRVFVSSGRRSKFRAPVTLTTDVNTALAEARSFFRPVTLRVQEYTDCEATIGDSPTMTARTSALALCAAIVAELAVGRL